MKVLIIQHEEDTPPGSILEWLELHKFDYKIHSFMSGPLEDNIDDFSSIYICGGEMNVDQEKEFPWLIEEKKIIKSCIKKKKKIIGLCLGAQLLAEALEGKVFKAPEWEIGWHCVNDLEKNEEIMAFHWHGYQFITPPGATKIAESAGCPHQGFKLGNNILALQFHPEATEEWIHECANASDIPEKTRYVQDRLEISKGIVYQKKLKKWFFAELDSFLISTETT